MPAALTPGHPVQYLEIHEYVGRLQQYFQETYAESQVIQRERAEAQEPRGEGRVSAELKKGDIVLVKREPTVARAGPLRFQERVYPDLYRVNRVISASTFNVEPVVDPGGRTPFDQPLNADRLVRLDMPEVPLDPGQPRTFEVLNADNDTWYRWQIERFAVDGRCRCRAVADPARVEWLDLSKFHYRWVL
jgi:hypothetical protein